MSDRDRVAQAICRAENLRHAHIQGFITETYEDNAEHYLELADAAIEAMQYEMHGADDRLPIGTNSTDDTTKRGTRLSPDWTPSDPALADLLRQYPHLNFQLLLAEFRDYWCAVPGQRGLKLSWDRTFRNSVRERADKRRYWRKGYDREQMSKVDSKAAEYLQ